MEQQTAGNMSAWDTLFSQWRAFADPIVKSQEGDEPAQAITEVSTDWTNITGFLCALGGVCLMSSSRKSVSRTVPLTSSESSSCVMPAFTRSHPDLFFHVFTSFLTALRSLRTGTTAGQMLKRDMCAAPVRNVQLFLSTMLQLLVCDYGAVGVQIRETVKESIGQELNPTLYVMLFEHLNATAQAFFDKGTKKMATPSNTLFIDQAIKIVKLILDNKLDHSSEYLALTDIEPLVMAFVRYLRQAELGEETLKTKIGLGNLISIIMARKRHLTFRHEMHFRNSMVEKLMEFVSTNEMLTHDPLALAQQTDLDIACMKAISACLAGLPLQPLYANDGNPMEAKSKMFLKYFTFFMNVTNRCRVSNMAGRVLDAQHGDLRPSSQISVDQIPNSDHLTAGKTVQNIRKKEKK